jgi:hypothetical protein
MRVLVGIAVIAAATILGGTATADGKGPCKTIDLERLGEHSLHDPALSPMAPPGCKSLGPSIASDPSAL